MSETHEQRIYDRCIIRVGQLEAENAELQAENDNLRKELAANEPLFETLNATNDGLIAENDKLRELVRNLYACINNRDCDYCEYADEACAFERNMRELGVEV